MTKRKNIWSALEVKTGKQISLWAITIATSIVFGNNVADVLRNVSQEPIVFGSLYLGTFVAFRLILGYLFD